MQKFLRINRNKLKYLAFEQKYQAYLDHIGTLDPDRKDSNADKGSRDGKGKQKPSPNQSSNCQVFKYFDIHDKQQNDDNIEEIKIKKIN